MTWHAVASFDALPEAQPQVVRAGATALLLVRRGADVFAIAQHCSHARVELTGGTVCDGEIECPAHGARFDLATGAAKCLPATRPIATYPVKLEGGQIYVALPS